ncbi:hypothetical protein BDV38DRAFT_259204 [Aspergillus pseudotamarii]|uniref:Uncharacterized protein n=1 Tax=Aspergillus pseudotamarii TaxID=132259 RepID=A0A5N6SEF7_ASPPS|nr:uncharacterized protein BDV38DRAFT_259204 [Aspergillus pseudotamarii]KAE8133098.1 hypothetical protein BDV38DRAFT_259204 [Aspergillus pseudotamarii]
MMDDRHASSLIPSCPYGSWKCSNYVVSPGGIGALLTSGVAIVRQIMKQESRLCKKHGQWKNKCTVIH